MSPVRVALTGDLIVDRPDPDGFFDPAREFLRAADLTVGQLEVPHATTTVVATVDVPAPPADPAHLGAVRRAGFDVLTLAGNHIADAGGEGIAQTLAAAHEHGLTTTGAGRNLAAALVPAVARIGDLSVGVLSFNCVGPTDSWATSRRPGAAYVRIATHYEPIGANPGGPPSVHTYADRETLARMQETVRRVAATVDVLVVALHKGLVHTPVDLAAYETEVAHAAVDAGASAVVGHHAHVPRGVELYRGRPVFHGLGNFVTVTDALTPAAADVDEQRRWAQRRRRLFGFDPDPELPSWYPFHPESRNTLIAVLDVGDDGRVVPGFVPCWIDRGARPVPWGGPDDGRAVLEHLRRTTRAEGFPTGFVVDGDVVRVEPVGSAVPAGSDPQNEPNVPHERGATP